MASEEEEEEVLSFGEDDDAIEEAYDEANGEVLDDGGVATDEYNEGDSGAPGHSLEEQLADQQDAAEHLQVARESDQLQGLLQEDETEDSRNPVAHTRPIPLRPTAQQQLGSVAGEPRMLSKQPGGFQGRGAAAAAAIPQGRRDYNPHARNATRRGRGIPRPPVSQAHGQVPLQGHSFRPDGATSLTGSNAVGAYPPEMFNHGRAAGVGADSLAGWGVSNIQQHPVAAMMQLPQHQNMLQQHTEMLPHPQGNPRGQWQQQQQHVGLHSKQQPQLMQAQHSAQRAAFPQGGGPVAQGMWQERAHIEQQIHDTPWQHEQQQQQHRQQQQYQQQQWQPPPPLQQQEQLHMQQQHHHLHHRQQQHDLISMPAAVAAAGRHQVSARPSPRLPAGPGAAPHPAVQQQHMRAMQQQAHLLNTELADASDMQETAQEPYASAAVFGEDEGEDLWDLHSPGRAVMQAGSHDQEPFEGAAAAVAEPLHQDFALWNQQPSSSHGPGSGPHTAFMAAQAAMDGGSTLGTSHAPLPRHKSNQWVRPELQQQLSGGALQQLTEGDQQVNHTAAAAAMSAPHTAAGQKLPAAAALVRSGSGPAPATAAAAAAVPVKPKKVIEQKLLQTNEAQQDALRRLIKAMEAKKQQGEGTRRQGGSRKSTEGGTTAVSKAGTPPGAQAQAGSSDAPSQQQQEDKPRKPQSTACDGVQDVQSSQQQQLASEHSQHEVVPPEGEGHQPPADVTAIKAPLIGGSTSAEPAAAHVLAAADASRATAAAETCAETQESPAAGPRLAAEHAEAHKLSVKVPGGPRHHAPVPSSTDGRIARHIRGAGRLLQEAAHAAQRSVRQAAQQQQQSHAGLPLPSRQQQHGRLSSVVAVVADQVSSDRQHSSPEADTQQVCGDGSYQDAGRSPSAVHANGSAVAESAHDTVRGAVKDHSEEQLRHLDPDQQAESPPLQDPEQCVAAPAPAAEPPQHKRHAKHHKKEAKHGKARKREKRHQRDSSCSSSSSSSESDSSLDTRHRKKRKSSSDGRVKASGQRHHKSPSRKHHKRSSKSHHRRSRSP